MHYVTDKTFKITEKKWMKIKRQIFIQKYNKPFIRLDFKFRSVLQD